MDLWTWITTTTSVDNVLTTLGLGALAILFASDRIITKGQHLRRVADLEAHHSRELSEKDARLATVDESRKEWRAASALDRERADRATTTMGQTADTLGDVLHVLESLNQAMSEATKR